MRNLALMWVLAACLMGCGGRDKDAKDKVETKIDTIDKSDSTPAVSQDSRLVNKEGEAWTCYTGGNRAGSYDGIIFQANGSFTFIIASGLLPDDEPIDYDVWNVETTGTWYTEGNKTITVSNNGRTYIMPYTIETTARSNERLFLDARGIYESIGDDCEIWCSNYGFYYRSDIKVMK
jgi:hypothetical protein